MKEWIMVALVAVFCVFWATHCTDESAAGRTLRGAGFAGVQYTGYQFFACGQGDFSATGFSATGPTGVRVNGGVCCGLLFKACTVRF